MEKGSGLTRGGVCAVVGGMKNPMSRRVALKTAAVAAAAGSLQERLSAAESAAGTGPKGLKGRVRHSVCKWCYPKTDLETLCVAGKEMGLQSIELLQPRDIPTLKKHGLTCAMVSNPTVDGLGGIEKAWNRVEHHDRLVGAYEEQIKKVAEEGLDNLICFSGNRAGLDMSRVSRIAR